LIQDEVHVSLDTFVRHPPRLLA